MAVEAFVQLNKPAHAAKAQEIVTDAKPSADAFYQLAVYSYAAGDTRTGDLASQRAVDLTPKDLRASLQDRLKSAKESAKGATGGGSNAAPGASTTSGG